MRIEVERPNKTTLEERDVDSWPIWEKEVSRFDWYYDSTEECYLLEGRVIVEHVSKGPCLCMGYQGTGEEALQSSIKAYSRREFDDRWVHCHQISAFGATSDKPAFLKSARKGS
jgi:hypothetical protein